MGETDPDPVRRWRAITRWYAEFAAIPPWEFLTPMVGLTDWVAGQAFAAPLLPQTSHEWLCVQTDPGYNPDLPFFSCGVRADGLFELSLWASARRRLDHRRVSRDASQATFEEFAGRLLELTEKAKHPFDDNTRGTG